MPHPKPVAKVNTDGWLTRIQASDMMGVAIDTLRAYERKGVLHPRRMICEGSAREIIVYNPEELARIPHKRRVDVPATPSPGECTARAFDLFDRGKSVREVVMELRETVSRVEELHEQWRDLGGNEIVIANGTRARIEACLGPFTTADELAQHIEEISAIAASGR